MRCVVEKLRASHFLDLTFAFPPPVNCCFRHILIILFPFRFFLKDSLPNYSLHHMQPLIWLCRHTTQSHIKKKKQKQNKSQSSERRSVIESIPCQLYNLSTGASGWEQEQEQEREREAGTGPTTLTDTDCIGGRRC